MRDQVISLLLVLATATWWQLRQSQRPTIVTICPHCGDIVEHAPGLFCVCPSCKRWRLG